MKCSRHCRWWFAPLLTACANAPDFSVRPAPAELTRAEFPGAARLLAGFSPLTFRAEWLPGDTVLYGLRLRRGAELQRWLLCLHVEQVDVPASQRVWNLQVNGEPVQFRSGASRVLALVADEHGAVLGATHPLMPRDFLARGLAHACERVTENGDVRRGRGDGVDPRLLAEAVVSAMALLDTVREDPLLSPILWQVVQRPSLWSVVSSLGVAIVVQPRFAQTQEVAPPLDGVPHARAFRLPIDLFVNDTPALCAELTVGTALPPFGVGGGILGAVARHPTDPDVQFEVLLLAARRAVQTPGETVPAR